MENTNINFQDASYSNCTSKELFEIAQTAIKNGEVDPLQVLHFLKKFSDCFEQLKKDNAVLQAASIEIAKHGEKCVVFGRGFKVQSMKVFDFKGASDPYLLRLESEIKKRKELLRNITTPFYDEHSEGCEVLPLKSKIITYIVMNDL
jgi:hypothetical protein